MTESQRSFFFDKLAEGDRNGFLDEYIAGVAVDEGGLKKCIDTFATMEELGFDRDICKENRSDWI